jgi:hypothetical protein
LKVKSRHSRESIYDFSGLLSINDDEF